MKDRLSQVFDEIFEEVVNQYDKVIDSDTVLEEVFDIFFVGDKVIRQQVDACGHLYFNLADVCKFLDIKIPALDRKRETYIELSTFCEMILISKTERAKAFKQFLVEVVIPRIVYSYLDYRSDNHGNNKQ